MRLFLEKWKNFLTDTVWSGSALLLMNGVAQFVVYPSFSRHMGDEQYGDVLYLISLVNIAALSVGLSANNLRLKMSVTGQTENGDYNIPLLCGVVVCIPLAAFVVRFGGVAMTTGDAVLLWLLFCVTILRYYSDVAFRLELNYRKFFCYYLFISIGYLFGVGLFAATGYWVLALLVGEVFGILYAGFKSGLYRERPLTPSIRFRRILPSYAYLVLAYLLVNAVSNSDRAILKFLINGTAVTIYYLASLGGKMISLIVTPLNSVIMGYLAKYKEGFTKRMAFQICCALVVAIIIGTFACAGASYLFIYLVYPQNLLSVQSFILIATLSQLVFLASTVFSTVMLRFSGEKYQIIMNIVFLGALCCFALPAAKVWGIAGFASGYLAAGIVRFLAVFLVAMKACRG